MTRFVVLLCLVSGGLAVGQLVQEDACDDSADGCGMPDTNMLQFKLARGASAKPDCPALDSYEGNECFTRYTDYSAAAVSFEKSSTIFGTDNGWRQCFSSKGIMYNCHLDGASVGHYVTMTFTEPQSFSGFRFDCGGYSRVAQQNVFKISYSNESAESWVDVAETDTSEGICGITASPGYAQWGATPLAPKWRFKLTEQHNGPWHYGFAWYTGKDGDSTSEPTPAPTSTTVTAFGDPHLKNIKKESFEVRRAGVHTLLNVPRGAAAVDTLLKVGASMERVEPGCSSLFIQSLDIMGQWLGSVPTLRFAAGSVLPGEVDGAVLQVGNSSALSIDEFLSKVPGSMITFTVPKQDIAMPNFTNKHATLMMAALKLGPGVIMKVSWTSERTPSASIAHSLWVSVAGLSTAHSTFGGLLGEDDHHDAATPDADCTEKGRSEMLVLGGRKDEPPAVAQASLE